MDSANTPTNQPTTSQEDIELMKQKITYLTDQLKRYMHLQHRVIREDNESHDEEEDIQSRRTRREERFDFKVEIPEFDGNLDPENFLDWMQTIERVFDLKEVL